MQLRVRFRRVQRTLAVILFLLIGSLGMHGQKSGSSVLSIRLERKTGDAVQPVPQNTVFRNGEILRFRLTSQIDGYLYVVDQGTTGSTAVLFPASGQSSSNHIGIGHSYVVPADGDGWFQVSGPAGFDVLYFLVSATPIALPSAPAANPGSEPAPSNASPPPPNLLPRCDDAIFKARGDCVDASAGVTPLPPGAPVPRELVPLARLASRDIVLTDDGDDTAVQAAPAAKLPMMYTFRLAHRE
jgi:hypothetical protein